MARDEGKLPRWAQAEIEGLRRRIELLTGELGRTREAHAVLMDREWFTLPGPTDGSRALWMLTLDDPFKVCSIGPGDVLLVGRALAADPEARR